MQTTLQLIATFALILIATSVFSADVKVQSYPSFYSDGRDLVQVKISGTISRNDLQVLQRQIDVKGRPAVVVDIDSPGGDWRASLALGRFLRKIEASVTVTGDCYSACVLILAAGIHRSVILGTVGIHRPYSTDTTPKTFLEAQRRYRALEVEARKYLLDMNMPEALFEAMVRVPPESIRKLTVTELDQFGLSQADPAAQEVDDSDEARKYGLTKVEYLRRKVRREKVCQIPSDAELLTSRTNDDKRKELIEAWIYCREAVMNNLK